MKTEIKSPQAPAPRGWYSQAVRVGNLLFISGQLPIDKEGRLVSDSITDQAGQALKNLQAVLAEANMGFDDLAQVVIYVSDIERWAEVNSIYEAFLGTVSIPPARAVVPVKRLHYGAQIEVQAIACVEN